MGGYANNNKPIVTDGLELCFDVKNTLCYPGTGTTITDLMTNEDATTGGNPVYNSSNGGYFVYDGTDDTHTTATATYSGDGLTAEVWCYINAGSSRQSIFSSVTSLWSDRRFLINAEINETPRFIVWSNNSGDAVSDDTLVGSGALTSGQWYHIVGTYSPTNGSKLYVDTTVVASSASILSSGIGDGTSPRIGSRNIGTSPDYLKNGGVAVARLYNRELTSTEITQNYNALKDRFI